QELLTDPLATPEERLQQLEHREILRDALHELPIENRRAIQLCKFSDCSLKDAARTLGTSVGALKARLHRGRRALTTRLRRKTQVQRKPAADSRSLQARPNAEKSLCAA